MKIILSRKGFDSQNGGQPNPIMPDGTLLSLPIPVQRSPQVYSNLRYGDKTYLQIIQELHTKTEIKANTKEYLKLESELNTAEELLSKLKEQEEQVYADYLEIQDKYGENNKEVKKAWDDYSKAFDRLEKVQNEYTELFISNAKVANEECHLDPDLREGLLKRDKGWLPMFGQSSAAEGHLRKQGVNKDDIFLFFGWFRQTELVDGKLRYVKGAPNQHIIYGYLQIGEIYDISKATNVTDLPVWMRYHPHAQKDQIGNGNNSIYVASDKLSIHPVAGGGCFKYHKDLVLTKQGSTKGKWELPAYFKDFNISYHTANSWKEDYFQSVDKGQEFVVTPNNKAGESKLINWTKNIIQVGITTK